MIKLSLPEWVNILFGISMIFVYIAVGLLIIFVHSFFPGMDESYRILFGSIIIIFGIFRATRVYSYINRVKGNNSNAENDEEN